MSEPSGIPVECPECDYSTVLHAEVYQRSSTDLPPCPRCGVDPQPDAEGLGDLFGGSVTRLERRADHE